MALLPRFHVATLDPEPATVTLDPDETHHLAHVLRIGVGASVEVFDGQGRTLRGAVATLTKKTATIDHLETVTRSREPRVPLTLAIGWLRTDHMDTVVRDATMLGVRVIQPLFTRRTTARNPSRDATHVMERWRRIAVGSLKQCGGAWMPILSPAMTFDAWVCGEPHGVRVLLTEPDATGHDARLDVDDLREPAAAGATVIVGPEGGWEADEVAHARSHGCHVWTLGPRVLRADAVPVAAISALRYAWERHREG